MKPYMTPAHISVLSDTFAQRFHIQQQVRLYSHVAGEWVPVDWPAILATLDTDRPWRIHTDSESAGEAVRQTILARMRHTYNRSIA